LTVYARFKPWAKLRKSYSSSLVDGCCSSGQWTEVVRVLKEIPGDGFGPDVVTCNLLMDYLCKEGLCADTRKIFASMDKKGLKPNVVTYSILLHGYATVATKGAFDVINNLFTSMMANGIAQTRAYGLVAAAGESHAAGRGSSPSLIHGLSACSRTNSMG
jgi:pentatricopeptide repeat protein